jgi:hypothetical protein
VVVLFAWAWCARSCCDLCFPKFTHVGSADTVLNRVGFCVVEV